MAAILTNTVPEGVTPLFDYFPSDEEIAKLNRNVYGEDMCDDDGDNDDEADVAHVARHSK